jgi:flavodoxin I
MSHLIVYDSQYGNTEKIARAIDGALGSEGEGECLRVCDVRPEHLSGIHLLVVGSPTQRFRATEATNSFLKEIPKNALSGVKVAAFDTRITEQEIRETSRVLNFAVKYFGYAARQIADQLVKKGGQLVISPEGFYVSGMEGPLSDGELERAAEWGNKLLAL